MAIKYKDRTAPLTTPSLETTMVNVAGMTDDDFFVTDVLKKNCYGGVFLMHVYNGRESSTCLLSVNDAGTITVVAGGTSVSYLADLDGGSATDNNVVVGWYTSGGKDYLGVKFTFATDSDLKLKLIRLV